jgi:diguanylate cyclase (GGDEF)-like protein
VFSVREPAAVREAALVGDAGARDGPGARLSYIWWSSSDSCARRLRALVEAAERWSKRLRASDTLARIGGDEFVVLLEEIAEPHAAATLAQNLIDATAAAFTLPGGREACVGLSVGVGLFPDNGEDAESLIQHAGSALDLAKQFGGSAVRFYSDAMTRQANKRLELEAGMRRGLERDEFVLQYQPLIALADRSIVGSKPWRAGGRARA